MTLALKSFMLIAAFAEGIADAAWDALTLGERILASVEGWIMMMATFVTNSGLDIITNRILGAGTEPKFVAWGTGVGTTAKTDTTLFAEVNADGRTSGTSSRVSTSVTNDTYQVVGTIVATAGETITNAGLFDIITSSTGNLFLKGDFAGLPLSLGDSIQFTFKAQFTN
jgi:hypothetical protein